MAIMLGTCMVHAKHFGLVDICLCYELYYFCRLFYITIANFRYGILNCDHPSICTNVELNLCLTNSFVKLWRTWTSTWKSSPKTRVKIAKKSWTPKLHNLVFLSIPFQRSASKSTQQSTKVLMIKCVVYSSHGPQIWNLTFGQTRCGLS